MNRRRRMLLLSALLALGLSLAAVEFQFVVLVHVIKAEQVKIESNLVAARSY